MTELGKDISDLTFKPAVELAQLIRGPQIGCRQLLDYYLELVEQFNPRINAIVLPDADRARERGRQADAALLRERTGAADGLQRLLGAAPKILGPTACCCRRMAGEGYVKKFRHHDISTNLESSGFVGPFDTVCNEREAQMFHGTAMTSPRVFLNAFLH